MSLGSNFSEFPQNIPKLSINSVSELHGHIKGKFVALFN
jgi:hypothetical protein